VFVATDWAGCSTTTAEPREEVTRSMYAADVTGHVLVIDNGRPAQLVPICQLELLLTCF
jgi:hypothetical protein